MAQIVVERSAIADFLDDLPSLLLQYKQMEYAQEERELDRESRKVERAEEIALKEYYYKKDQVAKTEAMYDKYQGIPDDMTSSGGADLINIIDNQNNIDMKAVTDNLESLSSYQAELTSGLRELSGQAALLKEMQSDFWGANKVLQEDEYREFQKHALQSLEEGGLGWSTTAGADVSFYGMDPTAREDLAYRMTERYTKEAKTGAAGSYALLQAIFTPGEGEDTGDLVNKLTYEDTSGNEIEPPEGVVAAIQGMAGQNVTYDDFIANLNAYPAESGGDLIREFLGSNPNTAMVYSNLKQDAEMITTLDNELAGINESDQTTDLENFVSNISAVSNKEALFGLYDQAVSGKDPALHEQFFNAVEAQLDIEDAGAEYMKYKGFSDPGDPENPADVGSLVSTQKDIALQSLSILNEDISADSTYMAEHQAAMDSLGNVQDYSYNRFLELAKIDPDNVDPWILPSTARRVWWGLTSPSNEIEEEIQRLGQEYRSASAQEAQMPFPDPVEDRLIENRAKKMEIERTLELLGSD